MRLSYLNNQFIPHNEALVHIEDRGFQFADGIYEVILFANNKLIDADEHINRLFGGLNEIGIKINKSKKEIHDIIIECFSKNNLSDGYVYLQITRGQHARIQTCPDVEATITMSVSPRKIISSAEFEKGFSAATAQDVRWLKCNIKTVGLLAASLTRHKVDHLGACEAILVRLKDYFGLTPTEVQLNNGTVTEGCFSNLFIVDQNNNLITKNADNLILQGITRNRIIALAQKNGINVIEKEFTRLELYAAKEVFLTSTTLFVRPIISIDGKQIGDGKVGEISRKLMGLYQEFVEASK